MENVNRSEEQKEYWSKRYIEARTGWDLGEPSRPLREYIDQLIDKSIKILIPGAGNAHEATYLFENGFEEVYVLDIAAEPLEIFQKRNPTFPKRQLIEANFFEHKGQYDLILEQTFFCSFPPTKANRTQYVQQMYELLKPQGKLTGLWFDIPLKRDMERRPFGGTKAEYLAYFTSMFEAKTLEKCYNSIEARKGVELFGVFSKK